MFLKRNNCTIVPFVETDNKLLNLMFDKTKMISFAEASSRQINSYTRFLITA